MLPVSSWVFLSARRKLASACSGRFTAAGRQLSRQRMPGCRCRHWTGRHCLRFPHTSRRSSPDFRRDDNERGDRHRSRWPGYRPCGTLPSSRRLPSDLPLPVPARRSGQALPHHRRGREQDWRISPPSEAPARRLLTVKRRQPRLISAFPTTVKTAATTRSDVYSASSDVPDVRRNPRAP